MNAVGKVTMERLPGGVAQIIWDNPPLNLTTMRLMAEFDNLLREAKDDSSVRVIIIGGAGERAFCVGSDLKEFPEISDDFVERKLRKENAVFTRIEACTKPVIAALNGHTLGGGCEMALACDFRVIDERATIGQPEIKIGAFPGSGGVFRLPKLIGAGRAMELLCLGRAISAQEAKDIGLVNRVAPAGKALEAAYALAYELACMPQFALQCIKQTVQASMTQTNADGVELSLQLSEAMFKDADNQEGVQSFLQKRKPRFAGAPDPSSAPADPCAQ